MARSGFGWPVIFLLLLYGCGEATIDHPAVTITSSSPMVRSPGETATISARYGPGAECSLDYTSPSGKDSEELGLDKKATDDEGLVSWSWQVGPEEEFGSGWATITCDKFVTERAGIVVRAPS